MQTLHAGLKMNLQCEKSLPFLIQGSILLRGESNDNKSPGQPLPGHRFGYCACSAPALQWRSNRSSSGLSNRKSKNKVLIEMNQVTLDTKEALRLRLFGEDPRCSEQLSPTAVLRATLDCTTYAHTKCLTPKTANTR